MSPTFHTGFVIAPVTDVIIAFEVDFLADQQSTLCPNMGSNVVFVPTTSIHLSSVAIVGIAIR